MWEGKKGEIPKAQKFLKLETGTKMWVLEAQRTPGPKKKSSFWHVLFKLQKTKDKGKKSLKSLKLKKKKQNSITYIRNHANKNLK